MKSALAPAYDLFKLVVTLILAAILLILFLRGCAATPPPTGIVEFVPTVTRPATSTFIPPTAEPPSATASPSPLPPSTETPLPPTAEPPTPISPLTETPLPPTAEPPTATAPPAPTAESTPTPLPGPLNPACPGAAISRLKIGDKVRVLQNLNMRAEPGLTGAWILTNLFGAQLEIIGGPACTPIGSQAYEWWRVRTLNGKDGWSAEGSLTGRFYFLQPIQ